MAKGKRAAALFEVIQSAKERQHRSASLNTPSWWFKRRPANNSSTATIDQTEAPSLPVMRELPPTVEEMEPGLMAVEIVAPPRPQVARPVKMRTAQAPLPATYGEYATGTFDDVETTDEIGAPPIERPSLAVNTKKKVFNLQFTYGTAVVAGFGVVVLALLAFIIGSALTRGPKSADAGVDIDQLRSGPAFPEVLQVSNTETTTPKRESASLADAPRPRPVQTQAGVVKQNTPVKPPIIPTNVKRIIGMQYILVQSYPDEEDATDAMNLLLKNGVQCTVEKNIPGWGSSWYCVLTTIGFERTKSNPDFDQQVKAIRDIGAQFGDSSKFKKFEPRAIGWREKTT